MCMFGQLQHVALSWDDYILGLQHTWRFDAFRPLQPQDLNIYGQTQWFKRRLDRLQALNARAKNA